MLTRCPRCETTFRVTPEQLKARHGKVRCGECQEVFNALDTLIEAPAAVAMPMDDVAPSTPEPVPDNGPADEVASDLLAENFAVTEAPEAPAVEDEPAEQPEISAEPESEAIEGPPAAEPGPAPLPELTDPPRRRAWPWVLGLLAAVCVLALQAAMHFRTEIAILHPETRPWFTTACEIVTCKLLLPRKAELMSIETSDLHPESGGKLGLSATLKNRAPFAQEFPHLEITLTDTADRALVRRVLSPADYLAPETSSSAGFATGKELPVELSIELADIAAVGYRLYLFYP